MRIHSRAATSAGSACQRNSRLGQQRARRRGWARARLRACPRPRGGVPARIRRTSQGRHCRESPSLDAATQSTSRADFVGAAGPDSRGTRSGDATAGARSDAVAGARQDAVTRPGPCRKWRRRVAGRLEEVLPRRKRHERAGVARGARSRRTEKRPLGSCGRLRAPQINTAGLSSTRLPGRPWSNPKFPDAAQKNFRLPARPYATRGRYSTGLMP